MRTLHCRGSSLSKEAKRTKEDRQRREGRRYLEELHERVILVFLVDLENDLLHVRAGAVEQPETEPDVVGLQQLVPQQLHLVAERRREHQRLVLCIQSPHSSVLIRHRHASLPYDLHSLTLNSLSNLECTN